MDFINTYRQSSATKMSRNSMTWVSAEKGMLSKEADSNHLVEKKTVSSTFKMTMIWKAIVIAMFIAVPVILFVHGAEKDIAVLENLSVDEMEEDIAVLENLSVHEMEKGDNFMNNGIGDKTRNLSGPLDDSVAQTAVCPDGRNFDPDEETYYRFTVPYNQIEYVWTYGTPHDFEEKIVLKKAADISLSDPKTHWRFVKDSSSSGKWQLINRATGSKIKVHNTNFQLAMLPGYPIVTDVDYHAQYDDFLSFEGMCNSNNLMWFSTYNNRGGVRPTGSIDGTTLQTKQTVFEATQTTYTTCLPFGTTESCPSGFSQQGGNVGCGVFNCCSKRQCTKHIEPHENQLGSWEFTAEPVSEYKRPDVKDAQVLQLNSGPAEAVNGLASSLMTNGAWLVGAPLGVGGAIGAPLMCLVLDATYFKATAGKSVDEKLDDFGTQIMRITRNFTLRTVGSETLHGVLTDVKNLRRRFLVNYQREKSTDVKDAASTNIMEMETLATELQVIGDEYRTSFEKLLPLSFGQVEDIDIERAKLSWDSMKMIAIELLAVYEERVALDAYISYSHKQQQQSSDSKTCNTIIQNSVYVSELTSFLKMKIMGTRDMLVNRAVEDTKNSNHKSEINPATGDYFSWEYQDEIKYDMEHFSYRYDEVIQALDSFAVSTDDACNRILTGSSSMRDEWRTFDPEGWNIPLNR